MFFIVDKEDHEILEVFNSYLDACDRMGYWLIMCDCAIYGEIK